MVKTRRLGLRNILVPVFLMASLTLACSLCRLPGLGDQSTPKHFETDEFSFDYPRDWQTFSESWSNYEPQHDASLDAEELGGVANRGFSWSFRIERKEIPPGSSLREVYEQTYDSTWISTYVSSYTISEGTTTVDGVAAYEIIYKRPHGEPWYQMRDLWLEKDGLAYILSFWATPQSFDEAQEDFQAIIQSFHVK